MAEEAFARPGEIEPSINRDLRRARLELAEKPTVANFRLWAVWGPVDRVEAAVPLRRLMWRRPRPDFELKRPATLLAL
jgi:hypothetical protein